MLTLIDGFSISVMCKRFVSQTYSIHIQKIADEPDTEELIEEGVRAKRYKADRGYVYVLHVEDGGDDGSHRYDWHARLYNYIVIYRYFGQARELPGVKELFEKAGEKSDKKTRGELLQCVNSDYYGYRDEDDGIIVEKEREASASGT